MKYEELRAPVNISIFLTLVVVDFVHRVNKLLGSATVKKLIPVVCSVGFDCMRKVMAGLIDNL